MSPNHRHRPGSYVIVILVGVLLGTGRAYAQLPDSNLVDYWSLTTNNAAGLDDQVGGRNVTLEGQATITNGALQINDLTGNSFANAGDGSNLNLDATHEFTISLNVNPDQVTNLASLQSLISDGQPGSGWFMYLWGSGAPNFGENWVWQTGVAGGVQAGLFQQVTITGSGEQISYYVNGALVLETNTGGEPITNPSAGTDLLFGATNDYRDNLEFQGSMNNVSIWDTALTAGQVASLVAFGGDPLADSSIGANPAFVASPEPPSFAIMSGLFVLLGFGYRRRKS